MTPEERAEKIAKEYRATWAPHVLEIKGDTWLEMQIAAQIREALENDSQAYSEGREYGKVEGFNAAREKAAKEADEYGNACILAEISHGDKAATRHGRVASMAIADRIRQRGRMIEIKFPPTCVIMNEMECLIGLMQQCIFYDEIAEQLYAQMMGWA